MLGEHHDIDHEFPEYHGKILDLSGRDPDFAALMKEHDQLDDQIRDLEMHDLPVSDFYIETLKKQRARLKDQVYDILRHAS